MRDIIGSNSLTLEKERLTESEGINLLNLFNGRFLHLKEVEDFLISEALKISGNNQGIAASMLRLTRNALNKRLLRKKK